VTKAEHVDRTFPPSGLRVDDDGPTVSSSSSLYHRANLGHLVLAHHGFPLSGTNKIEFADSEIAVILFHCSKLLGQRSGGSVEVR
jgi:hypothetical protein